MKKMENLLPRVFLGTFKGEASKILQILLKYFRINFAFTKKSTIYNLPISETYSIENFVYQFFNSEQSNFLINKRLSYLFEQVSWKFRINFWTILKIYKLLSLCKKLQKFVKLSFCRSFFSNKNGKSFYFMFILHVSFMFRLLLNICILIFLVFLNISEYNQEIEHT